ncbi:hypothetical protein ABAC460_13225 [Asticcacaulis sp. AC460]|uniref:GlcG/HbpS family heme-binding protein n=1 Tax=Asticcacaulis sp. AC460 TaxID=1282360 RepID=UPI0003C3FD8F|nr:heme-binding protein [Asticcacaulis sp. AC460]ESQ89253.1 hypothetical protein ABAC460_13225 [Asticcacaulis sp. AC460]
MRHVHSVILTCFLAMAIPVAAAAQTAPPSRYGQAMATDDALSLIDRARQAAVARGLNMAFAVVEPTGELVAFVRMEDAPYASGSLAQQKARSSARLRLPTSELETRVQNGRLVLLSSDEVLAVGGGVPIVVDGRVVGALGVSGGTSAQDAEVAAVVGSRP